MLAIETNWHGPGTIPRNQLWTCSSWKGTSVPTKNKQFTTLPQKNNITLVSVNLNLHFQSASFPGKSLLPCQHPKACCVAAKVRMSYSVTTPWIRTVCKTANFCKGQIWILKVSGTYRVPYSSQNINSKTSETNSVQFPRGGYHQGYPVIFYRPFTTWLHRPKRWWPANTASQCHSQMPHGTGIFT